MLSEGHGIKSPAPLPVILSRHERVCCLQAAQQRCKYRRYKYGKSEWQKGLAKGREFDGVGQVESSVRPVFEGIVGEWALMRSINERLGTTLEIDDDLREWGDNGIDIDAELTTQVKTRRKLNDVNRVRRVDHQRRLKPLACRAFVFCQWSGGERVLILGWLFDEQILNGKFGKSHVANHYNIEIPDDALEPISRYFTHLELGGGP